MRRHQSRYVAPSSAEAVKMLKAWQVQNKLSNGQLAKIVGVSNRTLAGFFRTGRVYHGLIRFFWAISTNRARPSTAWLRWSKRRIRKSKVVPKPDISSGASGQVTDTDSQPI